MVLATTLATSAALSIAIAADFGATRAPRAEPTTGLSYERWVRPRSLSPLDRQALQIIRRWSHERGVAMHHDSRLGRVARAMLRRTSIATAARLDINRIRAIALRWGVTDGQLAALSLRVPRQLSLTQSLRAQLARELRTLAVNRVGIASRRRGEWTELVAVLSRHLINLAPIRASVPPGETLVVAGGTPGDQTRSIIDATVTVALGIPGYAGVQRLPVPTVGGRFEHRIAIGDRRGDLELELLIDAGQGPEIAALLPIRIGAGVPRAWQSTLAWSDTDDADGEATDRSPEETLGGLILGLRRSERLPLPLADPLLRDVARQYAKQMQERGFFGHVSPAGDTVDARLKARGIRFAAVYENLAIGPHADAIFRQWIQSPAHRANLLARDVSSFGVGTFSSALEPHKIFAVCILAARSDSAPDHDLSMRLREHLNARRRALGMAPLQIEPALDRLAQEHSRDMATLGALLDGSPEHGSLADAVFEELDVAQAAVEVFVGDSVTVVDTSHRTVEPYAIAGVAVVADPAATGAATGAGRRKLWITVIYARD